MKRVDIKAALKDPVKRARLTGAGNLRQVDAGRYIVGTPLERRLLQLKGGGGSK